MLQDFPVLFVALVLWFFGFLVYGVAVENLYLVLACALGGIAFIVHEKAESTVVENWSGGFTMLAVLLTIVTL